MDQEPSWQRQLLIGLSALIAIGLLIGGVMAAIAVKAFDYAGLGGNSGSASSPAPILPTTGDATHTAPPPRTPATSSSSPTTPAVRTRRPPPPQHAITLSASPKTVSSFGRINLAGTYPGNDGASLQVQRSLGDGPWADFPVDTTVTNGTFATYIQTSMLGINHIRVIDKATGRTSNAVTVKIG